MKILINNKIAHAVMRDEANRSMRKAGRKKWNASDYNKGVKAFYKVIGKQIGN
jgi:hypothetical protein